MTRIVVDASVVIKWVVTESGTPDALALRSVASFSAPELLVAECANILWKKVRLSQLSADEAMLAARLIQRADIELHPMRALLEPAAQLALDLDHPAYDCLYFALAMANDWRFVTADARLVAKARQSSPAIGDAILSLEEAAGGGGRH